MKISSFWHSASAWRTFARTDRQTDGRTDNPTVANTALCNNNNNNNNNTRRRVRAEPSLQLGVRGQTLRQTRDRHDLPTGQRPKWQYPAVSWEIIIGLEERLVWWCLRRMQRCCGQKIAIRVKQDSSRYSAYLHPTTAATWRIIVNCCYQTESALREWKLGKAIVPWALP